MLNCFHILTLQFTPTNMPIMVKPMSTWLAYRVRNTKQIQEYLPEGMELAPIRILSGDAAEPKLLLNIYQAKAPFFQGERIEVVTIVKQKNNPRNIHFVVLDCLSNTLHWDPIHGIRSPNMLSKFKTSENHHQIELKNTQNFFSLNASFGERKRITKRFAVDANRLCFFRNSNEAIELKFDEEEVMKDVVSLSKLQLNTNLWKSFRGRLTHSFLHPHSMKFVCNLKNICD